MALHWLLFLGRARLLSLFALPWLSFQEELGGCHCLPSPVPLIRQEPGGCHCLPCFRQRGVTTCPPLTLPFGKGQRVVSPHQALSFGKGQMGVPDWPPFTSPLGQAQGVITASLLGNGHRLPFPDPSLQEESVGRARGSLLLTSPGLFCAFLPF